MPPSFMCPNCQTKSQSKYCSLACIIQHNTKLNERTGCLEWTKSLTSTGYGHFRTGPRGNTKDWKAHRASWIVSNGPIPEGMLVCHKCDNPACVNPDHLFLGSHKDNTQDMKTKGRMSPPPTFYGDAHHMRRNVSCRSFGAANGNSREARALRALSINNV